MRVGIDARLVSRGLGIAQFVEHLVAHLDSSIEVIWFGHPERAPTRVEEVRRADRLPYPVLDGAAGRRMVRDANLDVMHFTGNTGWVRQGPVPVVLTVHDLIFLDTPVLGRSARQAVGHRYLRRNVKGALRNATRVVCDSEVTAAEVRRRLAPVVDPAVIPLGVDLGPAHDHRPGPVFGENSYAVAFSARDPRKGAELALEGWRAACGRPSKLVFFAGAGVPDGFELFAQDELAEGRVEVLPYLSRDRLRELMKGASALIHASTAEGFGLPVVEAMAAGVPVISGLAATSEELAEGAYLPIDPQDSAASIGLALHRLHEEPELRQRLTAQALEKVRPLTWSNTANRYHELYMNAASC